MVTEGWDENRLENAFRDRLEHHGYLALFSHEIDLHREDVRAMMVRCLEVLGRLGISGGMSR